MSRIAFVTGGSGFVGKALIRRLVADGLVVRALARSKQSADIVKQLGAVPVMGDVNDVSALKEGCKDASVAYHLAAKVELDGPWDEFQRVTIDGTANVLRTAEEAAVPVFVHCSSEAAILGGKSPHNADETFPYPETPAGPYAKSKAVSEQLVVKANKLGLKTVVIRPRFIWGPNDTVLAPIIKKQVEEGKFMWVEGGEYLTSTTHIDNCVEGLIKGGENGKGGEVYFVTDGKPWTMRKFLTTYLKAYGADLERCWSVPRFVSSVGSWFGLTPKYAEYFFLQEVTVNDAKARSEIGYKEVVTTEEGLRRLQESKE